MRHIGIVLGVAAVMAATVVLAAGTALAQAAPQGMLDANNLDGQPFAEFATCKGFTPAQEIDTAQQFTAQSTGRLTSAQVELSGRNRDLGSLTGSFTMEITEAQPSGGFAGDIPGRVLASTTIPASEITEPLVTGIFSSPAQVVAGQRYVLLLRSDSPSCDYQFVYSLNNYLDLNAWALTGNPSTGWNGWGVFDLIFATYVTPPDTEAPEVVDVNPDNEATGVERGSTVSATFSEEVQAATLTSATVQLFSGNSTKPIKATLSVDPPTNPTLVMLTPSERLDAKNKYTVKIKGGAEGVKDLAGNPLASDFSWSFTTGSR